MRPKAVESLRQILMRLLDEDSNVVDAAATALFFSREDLGDPALKLNWYRSLPANVILKAQSI